MEARDLCLKLLECESEESVIALLESEGYWSDRDAWRYYGDQENNWSTIGNQQSSPHAALVEKLVNSVDATLMGNCYANGYEPTSKEAPKTMRAAVARFFEDTPDENATHAGLIRNWTAAKRTEVAQNITLVATGSKSKPCFTIADSGEGQTPDDMPNTLLSLAKSNKLRIPFVQGKFNMGGTGAFKFCGTHNIQLVISKRHPKAIKGYSRDASLWGFTIVRREDPERGRRSSVFTYLAPLGKTECPGEGGVLRFSDDQFPLFPDFSDKNRIAYGRPASWGTAIKLYEYSLPPSGRSNILMGDGLLRRTDLLLPDTALPIRFYESRDYRGHSGSFDNTLTGLSVRLEDDKTNNLEEGFPTSCPIRALDEEMTATVYAFKKGKAKTYRNDEGIIFIQNGQTHGHMTPDFFNRKKVGLSYLSDSLLVVIDCSQFTGRAREDLFMNSRDRLGKVGLKLAIEHELEDMLRNHDVLRQLKERRRREETEARLADSKPLEDVLENILKKAPNLANLFLFGKRATNPFKTKEVQQQEKIFEGQRFPSYFKFKGKTYGTQLERETPKNMRTRISFETDAVNDFFSRAMEAGEFKLFRLKNGDRKSVSHYNGPSLNNGIANLSIQIPEDVGVGESVTYSAVVTDPYNDRVFENKIIVLVKEKAEPSGTPGTRRKPPSNEPGKGREQPSGISLPNIFPVTEDQWPTHGFDKTSALKIKDAGSAPNEEESQEFTPTQYDFFINVDNIYLKSEMKPSKSDVSLLKAQFMYGMVLVGLGLLQQDIEDQRKKSSSDDEEEKVSNIEERVEFVSKALAPIILPMIDSLGGLDLSEVVATTSSGEAT